MRSLRLLFASPNCLLDRTNGAALTLQALLAALVRRGVQVRSLEAACFDAPLGADGLDLPQVASSQTGQIVRRVLHGVRHDLLVFQQRDRLELTPLQEVCYETAYLDLLSSFQPDVVLGFGGYGLERSMWREARLRGSATIFYLASPTYTDRRYFRDIDRVVTDTAATAALYRRTHGLIASPIGLFIDPARVVAPEHRPEMITFVNPIQVKGASLVVGLARLCLEQLPQARFLVVESRGRWEPFLKGHGMTPADLPNVEVMPYQRDMKPVYARSQVVLMPSYWHESAGMVALEALMNGIPVLASDHGGLSEILQGGAQLLHIPPQVRESRAIPPRKALEPWLQALQRLQQDPKAYQEASERARLVGAGYSSDAGVERFLEVLEGVRQRQEPARR